MTGEAGGWIAGNPGECGRYMAEFAAVC